MSLNVSMIVTSNVDNVSPTGESVEPQLSYGYSDEQNYQNLRQTWIDRIKGGTRKCCSGLILKYKSMYCLTSPSYLAGGGPSIQFNKVQPYVDFKFALPYTWIIRVVLK